MLDLQNDASKILRQLHGIFDLLCGSRGFPDLTMSIHGESAGHHKWPAHTGETLSLWNGQFMWSVFDYFWHPLCAMKSKVQFSHCFHLSWSGDACLGCDTHHVNHPAAWDIKRWLGVGVQEIVLFTQLPINAANESLKCFPTCSSPKLCRIS